MSKFLPFQLLQILTCEPYVCFQEVAEELGVYMVASIVMAMARATQTPTDR